MKVDPTRVVEREDAVGNDRVEMKIQVETAAEPLKVVERRGLSRDAPSHVEFLL